VTRLGLQALSARASLLLASLLFAPIARAGAHAETATPLTVSIPIAPTPADVGGSRRLFYEFRLASFAHNPGVIGELTVFDRRTGAVINDDKGDALTGLMARPGAEAGDKDVLTIPSGGVATIFMETTLPPGMTKPPDLGWRLDFHKAAETDPAKLAAMQRPIEAPLAISAAAPIEIGFPLSAGDWVAANGPSNTSIHRRSLQVVDGEARIAQRFAIDWVKLGPDGRLFHGDKAKNANWYGFGTPVLAVADAIVSAAHDGVPENEPSDQRAVPITLETVGGNYLILDLGAGHYAFYAHLQPGSARVKVGDRVHRGQVLALLGNTGNSDAPHLHFHIADANSPLGAEGLPYSFAAYQSLGAATFDQITAPAGWKPAPGSPIVTRAHAMPEEDEVVRVP
jgi:murein DD-endopeptidase MepM/ murein hydrolase activator NlpD